MCGRFKAGFEFREIKVRWQIFNDLLFTAHYNIAPTQTHPIIVERAGFRKGKTAAISDSGSRIVTRRRNYSLTEYQRNR